MDIRHFIAGWLRSPRHIGALAPSSITLARALAAEISHPALSRILELGAGTGVTTRALLGAGVSPPNLTVVERDTVFCRRLRSTFPDLCVVEGDARHVRRLLGADSTVDVVVSSLPLLALGPALQYEILKEIRAVLAPGGLLVQFTYGHGVPVHPSIMKRLNWSADRVKTVWRNLPPATIWRMQPVARQAAARRAA